MSLAFSPQQLTEHITKALGESLSKPDIELCLPALEITEPSIAKQFWTTQTAKPGIYLVLTGKARILDESNNLITTLGTSSSFGELTLFPQHEYNFYAARASANLKVGYIPKELIDRFPQIHDRLLKKAELWDSLILLHKNHLPNL